MSEGKKYVQGEKFSDGGSWEGNLWHPHGEPSAKAKAKAEEYNNEIECEPRIFGRVAKRKVFAGVVRFALVDRLELKGDTLIKSGKPDLLLPNHKPLVRNCEMAEGRVCEIVWKGPHTIKKGPWAGRETQSYDVIGLRGFAAAPKSDIKESVETDHDAAREPGADDDLPF